MVPVWAFYIENYSFHILYHNNSISLPLEASRSHSTVVVLSAAAADADAGNVIIQVAYEKTEIQIVQIIFVSNMYINRNLCSKTRLLELLILGVTHAVFTSPTVLFGKVLNVIGYRKMYYLCCKYTPWKLICCWQ